MRTRKVLAGDVRAALLSAGRAVFQKEKGTWKLTGGRSLDERALTVAVAFRDGVVIATMFWEGEESDDEDVR